MHSLHARRVALPAARSKKSLDLRICVAAVVVMVACSRERAPPQSRQLVPDTTLVDARGKTVHFYSDLVQGKTVLVNFIFTTCRSTCPRSGAIFGEVQRLLAAQRDSSISLISISVDPADTPEKLAKWAAQFGSPPGWTLLAGTEAAVSEVAVALTGAPARKGEHIAAVSIGDDATGRWTRVYGLQTPTELVEMARKFKTDFSSLAP